MTLNNTARPPETTTRPRIAAIVLAAGRSSRMGKHNKLGIEINGVPMVRRVVDSALASHCTQTLVVSGYYADSLTTLLQDCPVSWVHNADFAEGMAASLRCGLRALTPDTQGALILLGDMPYLTAAHINRLLAAFNPAEPHIIAPQFKGRRGNPVLWPRHYFAEIMRLQGDQGARTLLDQYAEDVVIVDSTDGAVLMDIDTPQALRGFLSGDSLP